MKRRTLKQKYADLADAYKCIRGNKKVKRQGTKDGSIATHPVIDIVFPKSEKIVLPMCLEWLRHHHIFCNRSNVGAGELGSSGYRGKLSVGQQKRMRDIRSNNGLYFVCHGVEELEYFMGDLI